VLNHQQIEDAKAKLHVAHSAFNRGDIDTVVLLFVVFVHAKVLPNESSMWQEIELVDVYTFQNGRVTEMRAFANSEDALHWVGIDNVPK